MWHRLPDLSNEESLDFEREFKKKARFLVDENMGNDVAVLLRDFKYNATFVGDVGLIGCADETVFAYAWKDKRILLTHDADFLDDKKFPFHRNPGVIVLPGAEGDGTLEPAIADLLRIVAPYESAHIGAKITVTQDRVWTIRGFIKREGRHIEKRIRLEKSGEASEWRA
jgi:predicted nuclease of predicted toxin-antitoxin system